MTTIFEIIDKSRRKIYLTDERWEHIYSEHPELIRELEDIKSTLVIPHIIIEDPEDLGVYYYHKFSKIRDKYLIVTVRYLNGSGFVITAYYKKIRKI